MGKGITCQDVFMIRTPSLPVEYLEKYNNQSKDIYEFIRSDDYLFEFFKNALRVTSASTYNNFIHLPQDKKKYQNLKETLLKYFLRSICRPTPYGYFATVALGEFSNETKFIQENRRIDISLDNEWLNGVLCLLENEESVLCELQLIFNRLCYSSGERIKNPYYTNYGKIKMGDALVEENSIRATRLIELLKKYAKNFISYVELVDVIREYYPEVPKDKIVSTIRILLNNEYLFSNLRFPAYCRNKLDYLISTLKKLNYTGKYYAKLIEIHKLIEEYKGSGKSEILDELYILMQDIYKAKNYWIVNIGQGYKEKCLEYSVKNKIEKLANSIYKMPLTTDVPQKIKDKFIEDYGMDIEVPLREIIDENEFNALSLLDDDIYVESEYEKIFDDIVKTKIIRAIIDNQDMVSFDSQDFEKINEDIEYPTSFDLNFLITSFENTYRIYLGPNIGSPKAGGMFQRFSECFDDQLLQQYNKIYRKERKLYQDECLLVEIREFSAFGKINNVVNNRRNYDYYINLGYWYTNSENEITLDDIWVGMSVEGNFYLKSKKHNKKIRILKDNMLNDNVNNKIVRLIKLLSEGQKLSPENRLAIFRNEIRYKYCPRIEFENIVIAPKSWYLNKMDVSAKDYTEFKKQLFAAKKIYRIDDIVYYVSADNRIPLDLNREDSIEILFSETKKREKIELQEVEKGLLEDPIVTDKRGEHFVNECVFSFISNHIEQSTYPNREREISLVSQQQKFMLTEDGWVYFKLYGSENRTNELLSLYLPNLIREIENENHFFIRYKDDEGKHLRVRLKFKDSEEALNKLPLIVSWAQKLRREKLISKIIFDVYARENNRYGGREIIKYCENVFFKDSILIERVLKEQDINTDLEKIYICGITFLLKYLTEDLEEMFYVLDNYVYVEKYRKEYRQKSRVFMEMIQYIIDGDLHEGLLSLYSLEKDSLLKFRDVLKTQIASGKNTNTKSAIIRSIVHMHCNRLTGDIEYEQKYVEIVRDGLYQIIKKRDVLGNSNKRSK